MSDDRKTNPAPMTDKPTDRPVTPANAPADGTAHPGAAKPAADVRPSDDNPATGPGAQKS